MFLKRLFAAIPLCILCLLAGCGDARYAYEFQGNAIPVLDKFLTTETGGVYITSLSPPEGGGEITEPVPEELPTIPTSGEVVEESSSEEVDPTSLYLAFDYQMFEPNKSTLAIKDYVELLMSERHGFQTDTDKEPDFSTPTGSVLLKRYAVQLNEDGTALTAAAQKEIDDAAAYELMSDIEKEEFDEQQKQAEEEQKEQEKAEKEAQKEQEEAEKEAKKAAEKEKEESREESEKYMNDTEKEAAKLRWEAEDAIQEAEEKAAEEAAKAEEKEQEIVLAFDEYVHNESMWFLVQIDWTPTSCLITLSLEDVPTTSGGGSALGAGVSPDSLISFSGAEMLMHSIVPAEIGLPGDDMSEYNMKPGPGFVMVDDVPCLAVYIYDKNEQYTNTLVATCFVSADGSTLYQQIDENSHEVKKVVLGDIPESIPGEGDELLDMALQAQADDQTESTESTE